MRLPLPLLLLATLASEAPAQEVSVLILGSGGPRLSERASVGNLVLVDGKAQVLVDAGSGTFARAGEAGVELGGLKAVLLTHLHVDHSTELPAFAKVLALDGDAVVRLPVIGPEGGGPFPSTTAFVNGLFGPRGLYRYLRNFSATLRVSGKDIPSRLGAPPVTVPVGAGLSVTAQAVHHGDAPALAFRLTVGGTSAVLASDVDSQGLPALAQLARGADLLLVSCAVLDPPGSPEVLYQLHSPPKLLGQTAAQAGVKALVLTHLPPAVASEEAAVLASVRGAFRGSVTFAADGLLVPVGKRRPTFPPSRPCASREDCGLREACTIYACAEASCPPACVPLATAHR